MLTFADNTNKWHWLALPTYAITASKKLGPVCIFWHMIMRMRSNWRNSVTMLTVFVHALDDCSAQPVVWWVMVRHVGLMSQSSHTSSVHTAERCPLKKKTLLNKCRGCLFEHNAPFNSCYTTIHHLKGLGELNNNTRLHRSFDILHFHVW